MEFVLLTITVASVIVAIGAIVHASRLTRRERLRSEARIAALAMDIRQDEPADVMRGHTADPEPFESVPADRPSPVPAGLFAVRPNADARPRFATVAGAGLLAVSAIVGVLVLTSGEGSKTLTSAAPSSGQPEATRGPEPLELIALAHERAANQLMVRGVVRSSSSSPLTAVVLLLDREGALIGTAYADVGRPEAPDSGGTADPDNAADLKVRPTYERRFVVSLPDSDVVGRYRVSFKRDDQVVPHVDRRG